MRNRGFTLIELMVAVAIVAITTAAGYTFYLNTFKFQVLQERQKEMQTRLQLAMDLLVNDIRSVGYGSIDPRRAGGGGGSCNRVLIGTRPKLAGCAGGTGTGDIVIVPGNATVIAPWVGTDTITLFEKDQFLGTLNVAANPSVDANNIIVSNPPNGVDASIIGKTITIGGFFSSVANNVATPAGASVSTITIAPALSISLIRPDAYPQGMDVYTVSKIVYSIKTSDRPNDTEPALFRSADDVDAFIASGIEDLQVVYHLAGGGTSNVGGAGILDVRISLTARTNDPDPSYIGGGRPQSEDHAAGPADSFRRMRLTRVVQLLND